MILTEEEEIMTCLMELEYSAKITENSGEAAPKPGGMAYNNAGAVQASTCPPLCEVDPTKIDIPWYPNPKKNDYTTIFFEHFFPSLKGKATIADRIMHNPRSGYCHTTKAKKIFPSAIQERPRRVGKNALFATPTFNYMLTTWFICSLLGFSDKTLHHVAY